MDTQTKFIWIENGKRKVNLSRVDEFGIKKDGYNNFTVYVVTNGKYLPLDKFQSEEAAQDYIDSITNQEVIKNEQTD